MSSEVVRAFEIESDVTGSLGAARGGAVAQFYVMSEVLRRPCQPLENDRFERKTYILLGHRRTCGMNGFRP